MITLVTGSEGFIGKHLVSLLDNPLKFDIKNSHDLTDANAFDSVEQCDIIFHLAATVGVNNFQDFNCSESFLNNRRINENVLKLAQRTSAFVVFASSSEVYGNCVDSVETDDFKVLNSPRGLYTLDKILMEKELQIYNIPHCCLRLFNIAGHGQDDDKGVVAKLSYEITHDIKSNITNDVRTFTDVRDCAEIMRKFGIKRITGVFNVAGDSSVTIKDLYYMLCKKYNKKPNYNIIKNSDIHIRTTDNSKIKQYYKFKYSLENIINAI